MRQRPTYTAILGYAMLLYVAIVSSVRIAIADSFSVPPPKLAFILGEWEADLPDNRFRMRIKWDNSGNQFKGYLTKNGKGSYFVGFKVGEHIWTAKLMEAGNLVEYQKWRRGANGVSVSHEWVRGKIHIDLSSINVFLSGTSRFQRVTNNH